MDSRHEARISSRCPGCREICAVTYSHEHLIERLRTGAAIEVICVTCSETWPLTIEERAVVAAGLVNGR